MKIGFYKVCSSGNLRELDLEFTTGKCTVIHEAGEKTSCAILALLAGVDDLEAGRLLLNDEEYHGYLAKREHLEVFSYVFDEGIMLANLSLRENLLLPFRKRFEDKSLSEFDRKVHAWQKMLGIKIDLNLRPVMIDAADRKFLSVIRGLLTEPELLLIDDPYYILNKTERQRMLDFLREVSKQQPLLIASADDDFRDGFADLVINLNKLGISCAGTSK
ncbi:MAG: hypothetical protein KA984_02480 [Candidatus Cloacimonetes bacterium]|nr:hypothetical protein [Candidatus Cloacimonadota bacterium]